MAVPVTISSQVLRDQDKAFAHFFAKRAKYPKPLTRDTVGRYFISFMCEERGEDEHPQAPATMASLKCGRPVKREPLLRQCPGASHDGERPSIRS